MNERLKAKYMAYVRFLNEREAPHALAVLRMAFGVALMANIIEQLLLGDVTEFYAGIDHGGIFTFKYNNTPYTLFRVLPLTAPVVYTVVLGQLVAACMLTLGLYTRAAAIVCFLIQMTLFDRMVMFRHDGDNVFRVVSWLMVLAPAGAAWSVDAAWRGKGQTTIPKWPRGMFMLQLALIYTRTGIVKMGSSWSFMDGWSALYLAVNLPGIARWPGDWAMTLYPITQVATFISKWFEVSFFLLPINVYLRRQTSHHYKNIWIRTLARYDFRIPYLLIGLLMHLGIFVLLDIGLFSVVMVSLYAAYLTPDDVRAATRWISTRVLSQSKVSPA
jgi:uncharacterized membrane protein YphA (DoxX/SURF4 family)